jgi:hypothetical protein
MMDESLEELRPKGREMVVLNLIKRTSDGYYNYKSHVYVIYRQPEHIKYEDPYVLNIRVVDIYCGVYQPYSCAEVEDFLNELETEYGYTVVKVFET